MCIGLTIERSSCALIKELTDLPAQKSKYWWIVLCIGLTIERSSCALVKVLKDLPRNGHTIDRSYCALVKLITVTWELSNFSPIITNFFCYDQAFDKKISQLHYSKYRIYIRYKPTCSQMLNTWCELIRPYVITFFASLYKLQTYGVLRRSN